MMANVLGGLVAPQRPFNRAATVFASLTALVLSVGFAPSAGTQTTTCGAPDLGGRVEVWSASPTATPPTPSRVCNPERGVRPRVATHAQPHGSASRHAHPD